MLKIKILSTLLLVNFIALPAFSKPDIKLKLDSQKVLIRDNKEFYAPAEKADPGDIILYTLSVSNSGDTEARKLQPTADIPAKTVYVPEKTDGKDYKLLFSIDEGRTFQDLPKIKVTENGKEVLKPAPLEMYQKIKWVLNNPLKPNQTKVLIYRTKVK